MKKRHSAMLASMYEIDSLNGVSDKLEIATSVSLIAYYCDLIMESGYDNVTLDNLINGLCESFNYYLKHETPRYLDQVRSYLVDVYEIYQKHILNETEIYLDDPELISYHTRLLAQQKKIPHQEVV